MIINYEYIDSLLEGYVRFLQDRFYEDGRLYMYSSHLESIDHFVYLIDAIFNRIRGLGNGLIHETFLNIEVQLIVDEDKYSEIKIEDLFILDEDSYSSIQLGIAHNEFFKKRFINFISPGDFINLKTNIIHYAPYQLKEYKIVSYFLTLEHKKGLYQSFNLLVFPPENNISNGF